MNTTAPNPDLVYAARVAARVHGGDLTEDQAAAVVTAVLDAPHVKPARHRCPTTEFGGELP